jgi:hypothetical protein
VEGSFRGDPRAAGRNARHGAGVNRDARESNTSLAINCFLLVVLALAILMALTAVPPEALR